MKICAYIQGRYAKQAYKKECFNIRQWIGLSMCLDALRRAGYVVEYAGRDTVHEYDLVLVSLTSDCDWWTYVAERATWRAGHYLTICGGPGVLNIRPWLSEADIFVFGRGEEVLPRIVESVAAGRRLSDPSVAYADSFSVDNVYRIAQAAVLYPHKITLESGNEFREGSIGCPHKCLFCAYTWTRRYIGDGNFSAGSGLWTSEERVRERAILDMARTGASIDLGMLRITAIDGMSERLRRSVNKNITHAHLEGFLSALAEHTPPHQMKIYNIVGYPSETEADWREFLDALRAVDARYPPGKQWSIVLHNTPLRPMPATPIACWPAAYREYRGAVARALGRGRYKGNIFYQGNRFWAVEGMGCDSLPTLFLSMLCHRGVERDGKGMRALACTPAFWRADTRTRLATLERYFDRERVFSAQTPSELPTRYLSTYAPYRHMPPPGVTR